MDVVGVVAGTPDRLDPPASVADVMATAVARELPGLRLGDAGAAERGGRDQRAAPAVDREPVGDRTEIRSQPDPVVADIARGAELAVAAASGDDQLAASDAGGRRPNGSTTSGTS